MSRARPAIKSGGHSVAALSVARRMPAARHWVGRENGERFDPSRSEVLAWLSAQPAVRAWAFDAMRASGAIKYDKTAKCWEGVDAR